MTRVLVALSCAVLMVGCSESSSTTQPPPPPPSPTSASPSPTTPEERETPEEFVRRWVEVDREMQNTGDTGEYRAISKGCRPCQALADQVESFYRAGGYVKTGGWSVDDIRVSEPGAEGRILATVAISSAPTEYRSAADAAVQHLDGGSLVELMTLKPRAGSWLLVDLEQQAQ